MIRPRSTKVKRVYRRKTKTGAKASVALIKKVIKGTMERKYVDSYCKVQSGGTNPPTLGNVTNYSVQQNIVAGGLNTTAWSLIPSVIQGTAEDQRIGNRIENARIHFRSKFWLAPSLSGQPAQDVRVKIFICRPKLIKSFEQFFAISTGIGGLVGTLLNLGDGTTSDWAATTTGASPTQDGDQSMLPVSRDNWQLLKTREFRLTKNQDAQWGGSGAGSAPNLTAQQFQEVSFTYKHKGALMYQDPTNPQPLGAFPTNLCLVAFAVVYQSQNQVSNYFANGAVYASARSSMSYTDA